ncbi:hypothetical protein B0H19DRAFT_1235348 [Mycena capillaripes]|nr:hypothetical protein B0H19DRAFT_1235348 [Mycena capillaripes]
MHDRDGGGRGYCNVKVHQVHHPPRCNFSFRLEEDVSTLGVRPFYWIGYTIPIHIPLRLRLQAPGSSGEAEADHPLTDKALLSALMVKSFNYGPSQSSLMLCQWLRLQARALKPSGHGWNSVSAIVKLIIAWWRPKKGNQRSPAPVQRSNQYNVNPTLNSGSPVASGSSELGATQVPPLQRRLTSANARPQTAIYQNRYIRRLSFGAKRDSMVILYRVPALGDWGTEPGSPFKPSARKQLRMSIRKICLRVGIRVQTTLHDPRSRYKWRSWRSFGEVMASFHHLIPQTKLTRAPVKSPGCTHKPCPALPPLVILPTAVCTSSLRRRSLTAARPSATLLHLICTVFPSSENLSCCSVFGDCAGRLIARDGFSAEIWTIRGRRTPLFKLAYTGPQCATSRLVPSATSSMAPFRLESTLGLGVIELGIFATLVLFGILIVQVYIYYLCSSDRALIKYCVFEACHTGVTAQAIYYWTVTLADVHDKPGTVSGLSLGMVFETLITFLVQTYYILRVYRFSQNVWISALLFTLCLGRLAGGVGLSVGSFLNLPQEPDYFSLQNRLGWLVTATFSVGASVDVFVAASLCVYVYRWKTVPTLKTTSQLINRIMFWSIQTGLITSLISVAVVICFQTMKENYIWIGVFAVLGKLYSNSLLASLNIRSLQRKLDANTLISFALFSDDATGANEAVGDVEFARSSLGPSLRCVENCSCSGSCRATATTDPTHISHIAEPKSGKRRFSPVYQDLETKKAKHASENHRVPAAKKALLGTYVL